MLSHFRMADALGARRHYNAKLFPAARIADVFDWAARNGRHVEHVDPQILGPGFTEPSMFFERYASSFPHQVAFQSDVMESAAGLIAYAASRGGEAFYEVSLDDSDGARLFRHPMSKAACDPSIWSDVIVAGDKAQVLFGLIDNAKCVAMPPDRASLRADGLWKTTCFEIFVLGEGDGYAEFNLSPSTEWAAYEFDACRLGMRNAEADIAVRVERLHSIMNVVATIRWDGWSHARRLGLSAVIEATDGTISYWALAHPSDKPDFHHPDSFVLELP